MKSLPLFLSISSLVILTACSSTTAEQVQSRHVESIQANRTTEVQAMCAQHYTHIKDKFTRDGKIRECMRARNALQ